MALFIKKQDPVVSVPSHSPLLTYTCLELLSYRASLSSHNVNITNRVTGNKCPVTWARLPPPSLHMLPYPSLSGTTLFLPTSAALLAVYFIQVPGGPLRVKCQRPGSSQTRNEYEMIQRGCGKENVMASRQKELRVTKEGPDWARLSRAGPGWHEREPKWRGYTIWIS